MISPEQIRSTYPIIRPHIRRTPIIDLDGADFGITAARLVFKLESLQHAGSFKSRGAFTNLLTRTVPAAGVGAASGGNRGAAVAFAAGAAALAALTSGRYAPAPDERIAVLICGGNSTAVDFER